MKHCNSTRCAAAYARCSPIDWLHAVPSIGTLASTEQVSEFTFTCSRDTLRGKSRCIRAMRSPLGDGMQDKTTNNLLFGDLLACTPLAENVRRWRSARVSDSVMDEKLREKLRPMFEAIVNQHADLLKPAWA